MIHYIKQPLASIRVQFLLIFSNFATVELLDF